MSYHVSATPERNSSLPLSWVFSPSFPFAEVAPIALRLIVGYGFLAHGMAKVGRGPEHFARILDAIGIPFPFLISLATIGVEIFGGLLVLAGAFMVIVSVPMIIVLLVAMFTVHWQYGFSSIKLQAVTEAGAQFGQPGYECDLLYIACIVALLAIGPGRLAIDTYIAKRLSSGR
jgi:putative oxidoreductase